VPFLHLIGALEGATDVTSRQGKTLGAHGKDSEKCLPRAYCSSRQHGVDCAFLRGKAMVVGCMYEGSILSCGYYLSRAK